MLLLGSLTASFVQAKIMDDDINLVCDYYLIAVTTTFKQDVQNSLGDNRQHKAGITYDVVTLVEGKLAPRLNPQDSGWITDTEIGVIHGSGYLTINRQSGLAVKTGLKGDNLFDAQIVPISRHSCTSHSRKALDSIITRHNRAIKESTSDRKF
jgi:hypothetical protein